MPVRIRFDTGNAAFDWPNGTDEAARILRDLAETIENGRRDGNRSSGKIFDLNGNSIGTFAATFRKEGR